MTLNLDNLVAKQAIVEPRSGFPTGRYMLLWQRHVKELERADKSLTDQLELIQQQQAVIVQLIGVLADNVVYQNDLADWQALLNQFIQQRVAYLQIAVAMIATQGGFTIPDPSGLPVWPGDPPAPPFP